MSKDNGGPAFPQSETQNGNTVHAEHGEGGMTLRDYLMAHSPADLINWLAKQGNVEAATGVKIAGEIGSTEYIKSWFAADAVLRGWWADAMLAEREKQ